MSVDIFSHNGIFRMLFLAFFILLFGAGQTFAKTDEELSKVEQELLEQKAQADALEKMEKDAFNDISSLQKKLVAATAALQEKQSEQQSLESKLDLLEKEADLRVSVLADGQSRLIVLTDALLRLSRQPPEAFLLRSMLTDDHIHRAILLRSLLPRIQSETDSIARELNDLEMLRRSVAEQKNLVTAARQNLEWQRSNLDQMVKVRQGLLQKTVAEKTAITKQLASLAAEAKDLRQLMDKVNRNPPWIKEKKPAVLQSGMKMPVVGRIIRDYGAKDAYGVASQGLTFAAVQNSPIVAPQDGRIVFAGPFRGYGQIVILQHGEGYHSFLAGFGRIDAEMGQKVTAGEPLGVLTGKGASSLELYFEWRRNGEPINPVRRSNINN